MSFSQFFTGGTRRALLSFGDGRTSGRVALCRVALCRVALSGGLGQAMSVGHGDAADDGPDDAHEALVGPAEEQVF